MSEINCKNCDKIEGDTRKKVLARRAAADVARCALFVALMVVSAFISIPVQPVPFTFQTVVAVLAGLLLGPKRGGAAVAIYVFMGLLGLPVFTKGGGFAYVYQLTFGYVVGFAAAAFAAGLARGKGKLTLPRAVAGSLVGFFVNYAIGIPYFALIWKYYMHLGGLWKALDELQQGLGQHQHPDPRPQAEHSQEDEAGAHVPEDKLEHFIAEVNALPGVTAKALFQREGL